MPVPIIGKLELPGIGSIDALPGKLLHQLDRQATSIRVLAEAGFLRPMRPDTIAHMLLTLRAWGNTPAAGYIIAGLARADETAIIDEIGSLSFSEINRRTDALANSLEAAGVGSGDNIGVMCRNHRGFIEAVIAISKLGGNTLLLNTGFAGPQLADVCEREGVQAIIHDAEFTDLLKGAAKGRQSFIGWVDEGDKVSEPTIEELIEEGDPSPRKPPREPGRVVILTSGTTGTPKGAGRHQPKNLDPGVSLLSVIPLRSHETTLIAAPLFHSWGFAHFTLGLLLSSTFLLRRRFDPEDTLATIERYRPTALAVVPVMLQRIMELPEAVRHKYDTASLHVVAASGSALPGELATRFMDDFGDVLYNLYGSTEVAWATIATPRDLRQAPGTAGKPPWNTTVRLFDENNQPVEGENKTGRIFVASGFEFEGYTGGAESKAQISGLMSTGDVGYFDSGGRLFVEGRDDEMIVSGGENVFPREIEDLIASRKEVSEVAVVGVKDKEFGQRLKAFVVLNDGAKLSDAEVKDFVKSNTARFKVPREVEFIKELPRNPTGKVLKRELVAQEDGSGAKSGSRPAAGKAGAAKPSRRAARKPKKTPT
ncbi:MAG: AMP-binding protein [Candidatus Dormibacteraeota bacterium]|nr:AMP-binding protein [Candidatus Dormibacteraeota bacterium]